MSHSHLPDSMGFYTKVTALDKIVQVSTAAAAAIGLWYGLDTFAGQRSAETGSVAAIGAVFVLSVGIMQGLQWLLGQFRYVYQQADQQRDLARLTNLTENVREEPTVGYRP